MKKEELPTPPTFRTPRGPAARNLKVVGPAGEIDGGPFLSLKRAKSALIASGLTGQFQIIEVVWEGPVVPVEPVAKTKLG